jgi:hypothetical protein
VAVTPPERHWRSYGTEPLPPAQEALDQPLAAFPSWFLRIPCDRSGKGCGAQRDALGRSGRRAGFDLDE